MSRRRLSAAKRRSATVEAVLELARDSDPLEITTGAVAGRMEITKAALFHHFGTKEEIWRTAMEWVATRLLERINKAANGAPSPLAALSAVFAAHAHFVADHPGAPRMLFRELQRPGSSPAKALAQILMRRYAERISGLLEAGKAQGELSATLDADAAALLFLGAFQGLLVQAAVTDDPQAVPREAPKVFAAYCRGLQGPTRCVSHQPTEGA